MSSPRAPVETPSPQTTAGIGAIRNEAAPIRPGPDTTLAVSMPAVRLTDTAHLIRAMTREGRMLNAEMRAHPRMQAFFRRERSDVDPADLHQTGLRFLRLTTAYAAQMAPALQASASVLCTGDGEDRCWSARMLGGHDEAICGLEGAAPDVPSYAAAVYGQYFVREAERYPYAILGAKGVLARLVALVADDLMVSFKTSGIDLTHQAVHIIARHAGARGIERVRAGNQALYDLMSPRKCGQVLIGACFTSGIYRMLVDEHFSDATILD